MYQVLCYTAPSHQLLLTTLTREIYYNHQYVVHMRKLRLREFSLSLFSEQESNPALKIGSYLPKVSDLNPEPLLILLYHKCPEKEQPSVIKTQWAWGSLCSTLLDIPGICRESLHLHFQMITVNNNNLVLALIYQNMTLGVMTTKLYQTMSGKQNSKESHFSI